MSEAWKCNLAVPFFTQRDNTFVWQAKGNAVQKMLRREHDAHGRRTVKAAFDVRVVDDARLFF